MVAYGDDRLQNKIGGGKAGSISKDRAAERDVEKKVL